MSQVDCDQDLAPDPSWSFADLTPKQKGYATHAYHRYPAKFIPQLAARLIKDYSDPGDLVVDPFMGSGTTLVESKLLGRASVGTDVNPVSYMVALAKTTPIAPSRLRASIERLKALLHRGPQLLLFAPTEQLCEVAEVHYSDRLRYWFDESTLRELSRIQAAVDTLEEDVRGFFYCALSHVLKPLSFWNDRSVKPSRIIDKKTQDPQSAFFEHVARMERGNQHFWNLLNARGFMDVPSTPYCTDARRLPLESESVDLVVTSPPYVTSYEYSDLHQLSALWFRQTSDLAAFRRAFIGRSNVTKDELNDAELHSPLAEDIVASLKAHNPKKAREVAKYFADMQACFVEMNRVLKTGGHACIVIGNTSLCGVEVQNAQVFIQQLTALGFSLHEIILREIPSKTLPQTRDKATGKFASARASDRAAYPTEHILIVKKTLPAR